MTTVEPTTKEYIRQIIREELVHSTPRIGVVTDVHPRPEQGANSNYEVDVEVVGSGYPGPDAEGDGAGVIPRQQHTRVPVSVSTNGASRGLEVDTMVLLVYLEGESDRPVVTDVLYDRDNRAPLTQEGDFRRRIGDDAIIEIVSQGSDQMLNIGRQPEDRDGIDMGLSMNLSDGSVELQNGSEHGLFFDGDGNGILKWESMAMPWGAAGAVNWEDMDVAGWASDDVQSVTITVEDENGEPVSETTVSIEQDQAADDSTDGSTDDGSTDDGSTDDGSTDDGSTDDGSTDDGVNVE